MPARKARRRAPQQKWSTKFKKAPVKTLKSNWKSMGPVGKAATVAVAAGMVGGQAASQINNLPVIGRFMRIGTSFGSNLRARLRL
jgi:hypothetical protein|tara:strand:+ start:2682 stop:2936 length:255 start_codon:yes stop_codon:yes gene_type:complete